MKWNWQQNDWPRFRYQKSALEELEAQFLKGSGLLLGATKHLHDEDEITLRINMIADEAVKTSEIEGEYLNRESVQSSLRRCFGIEGEKRKATPAEQGISEMLVDLYRTYGQPLDHSTLFSWHTKLMKGRSDLEEIGVYRTHADPMQVVSGSIDNPKVHFQAPPSKRVPNEMNQFLRWFNDTAPATQTRVPALTRCGMAHLYFVSIHPFEDGNGRLARALSEKTLAQSVGQPTLVALAQTIHRKRKTYYHELESHNQSTEITGWLVYHSKMILEAQETSRRQIEFLIKKTKFFDRHRDQLNQRQIKVMLRIFQEGPDGFDGGLSADNYIRITRTSRATATRDLNDLVVKGALTRKGELKGTRYYLTISETPRS